MVVFIYVLHLALMGSRCPLLCFRHPLLCFGHIILKFWHILLCIPQLHIQCWRQYLLILRPGWMSSLWLVLRFYPRRLIQPPIFGVTNHSHIMFIIWWGVHTCSMYRRLCWNLLHGLIWRRLNRLRHSSHHCPLMRWIIPLLRHHRHKPLRCSHLVQ